MADNIVKIPIPSGMATSKVAETLREQTRRGSERGGGTPKDGREVSAEPLTQDDRKLLFDAARTDHWPMAVRRVVAQLLARCDGLTEQRDAAREAQRELTKARADERDNWWITTMAGLGVNPHPIGNKDGTPCITFVNERANKAEADKARLELDSVAYGLEKGRLQAEVERLKAEIANYEYWCHYRMAKEAAPASEGGTDEVS